MANIFTLTNREGQLPLVKATLYLCPPATQTVIKNITVTNTDVASRTFNLYINNGGGSRLISVKDQNLFPKYKSSTNEEIFTLVAGDIIEGDASAANKIDYFINGVEET